MIDSGQVQNRMDEKLGQLAHWRQRYSEDEYPNKIVINLFYELYTIHFMWGDISSIFSRGLFSNTQQEKSFGSAFMDITEKKRVVQIEEVRPKLMEFIEMDFNVMEMSYSQFGPLLQRTCSRDNAALDEIEFTYAYMTTVLDLVYAWAACGLTGMDKVEACRAALGAFPGTDYNLQSLLDVYKFVNTISNPRVSAAYRSLPALW